MYCRFIFLCIYVCNSVVDSFVDYEVLCVVSEFVGLVAGY